MVADRQHHLLLDPGGEEHAGARLPHRGAESRAALHEEPLHGRRLQDPLAAERRLPVREGRPLQVTQGGEGSAGQVHGEWERGMERGRGS